MAFKDLPPLTLAGPSQLNLSHERALSVAKALMQQIIPAYSNVFGTLSKVEKHRDIG